MNRGRGGGVSSCINQGGEQSTDHTTVAPFCSVLDILVALATLWFGLFFLYSFLYSQQDPTCCPVTTAWGVPSSPTRTSVHQPSSSLLTSTPPPWGVNLSTASQPQCPATPPSSTATTQRPLVIIAAPRPSLALEVPSCLHQPCLLCCLPSVQRPHICFW